MRVMRDGAYFGRGREGEAVRVSEDHEITAPLARFNVPLVAKQGVGVLDRHGARFGLVGEQTLGGELGVVGVVAAYDVLLDLTVDLQIGGADAFVNFILHLVI